MTKGRLLSQKKTASNGHDRDSSVSLESDSGNNASQAEEEEGWIDFIKRNTRETEDRMRTLFISCLIETLRKLKCRLATKIASHSEETWTKKQHGGSQAFAQQQERTDAWEDRREDWRMA